MGPKLAASVFYIKQLAYRRMDRYRVSPRRAEEGTFHTPQNQRRSSRSMHLSARRATLILTCLVVALLGTHVVIQIWHYQREPLP